MTTTSAAPPVATANGGPRPGPPGTLAGLFFDAVRTFDKPASMLYKSGEVWRPISHRTFAERVRHLAFGLRTLGVGPKG